MRGDRLKEELEELLALLLEERAGDLEECFLDLRCLWPPLSIEQHLQFCIHMIKAAPMKSKPTTIMTVRLAIKLLKSAMTFPEPKAWTWAEKAAVKAAEKSDFMFLELTKTDKYYYF